MDELTPSGRDYGIVLTLILALGVAAAVVVGPLPVAAALVGLAVLALVPGLLFQSKGYTFVEGWMAGLALWPLAVAFGVFGPAQHEAAPPSP